MEDDSERAARIVANEARFRQVNEELVGMTAVASTDEVVGIVCECGQGACADLVSISRADYEAVRSDPAQFVVKPGHEVVDVEDVVHRGDDFLVVRKRDGLPEELAEATDPRA